MRLGIDAERGVHPLLTLLALCLKPSQNVGVDVRADGHGPSWRAEHRLTWAKNVTHLRITTLGRYHVNQLVRTFTYVDAVVIDTPILDARVRDSIDDVRDIFERIARAREFVEYLSACAKSLQDGDSFRLWSDTYNDLQKSINGVHANAKKWDAQRGRS